MEEMPPDVRRAFERVSGLLKDEDGDGIPDIVQREGSEVQVVHQATYTVNGVTYNSPAEMPADVRRVYEDMMGPLDADDDGIPDALQLGRHRPLSMSAGQSRQSPRAEKSHAPLSEKKRGHWIMLLSAALLLSMAALIALVAWVITQ